MGVGVVITVLTLRGIGEPLAGATMCSTLADLLTFEHRVIPVPWDATYGPVGGNPQGKSYERAVTEGAALTLGMIDADPYPVVLLGYSGGAAVAGEAARQIADGQHPGLDVRAVGLVADPQMPRSIGAREPGGALAFGVAGSRDIGDAVSPRWAWAPPDPICCTPELSPLRTIADQSAALSLADPVAWGRDLVDRLLRGRWQPSAWDWRDVLGSIRRYGEAADAARRYLTGEHWRHYPGMRLESLAREIDDAVAR